MLKIARRAFKVGPCAVLRLGRTVQRNEINRVRPGVAHHEIQPFPRSLRDGRLQSVIARSISVLRKLMNPRKWQFPVERATCLFTAVVGSGHDLIDVAYVGRA